jgi:hypothetical protein
MAKSIGDWKMIIRGSGDTMDGAEVEIAYATESSVDADHQSRKKPHPIESPVWSKTASAFVLDEIAAIKSAEGIS